MSQGRFPALCRLTLDPHLPDKGVVHGWVCLHILELLVHDLEEFEVVIDPDRATLLHDVFDFAHDVGAFFNVEGLVRLLQMRVEFVIGPAGLVPGADRCFGVGHGKDHDGQGTVRPDRDAKRHFGPTAPVLAGLGNVELDVETGWPCHLLEGLGDFWFLAVVLSGKGNLQWQRRYPSPWRIAAAGPWLRQGRTLE